ncbi:pentatricopeptide repeat-containing protein At3g49170, chloroplastic-like isoform X1 [Arachis ipaensis]|nr:pentatricopeptide repeat-containing protein At3g49170, chloroplastic-like isoform X1 [Arachis ipaensis]XP_020959657.1 pentatricopeptide repeat-containing protein At3g49170, chloroplastic-like isoform X1 [Arachis ipaensis]XP_020959664.1 pentatricopeptide repeat-containing protein At3g49170, chloroplastic-like isoform X1 [Arachis ipaensis]XP_020959669.1 pentatricopeptide repeat-containing protein At3g49170, chloroplastic-like isoform X1 [Arachis ipaensis]XP_020959673.1 pentatricopeptide repeat
MFLAFHIFHNTMECVHGFTISCIPESSNAMNAIALGTKPTKHVLCATLSSCAKTLNWPLGIQIHAHIIRSGYEDNLFLSSALVDFYAKCDSILEAKKVFTSMKVHDKVSWTSLISGFSINGQGKDAFLLFKDMLGTQIKPNSFTFASVIGSCVRQNGGLEKCSILHAHVVKRGFCAMNFVLCSLVDCYAKLECVDDAALVFDESNERDSIVYNSMISGYCQNLYYDDALKLFVEMRQRNLGVTDHTLCSVLNACSGIAILLQGRQVHSVVVKMGSEQNVFVVSALIDMYSKGGDIGEARAVLDQASNKNSVLWTSMIMAYAHCGRGLEALELFDHLLVEKEFIPDHVCFTAILTACNHAGFLHKGVEYFNKMSIDYQLSPDIDQYACLIDLYARNGNLRRARDLMVEMPYDPNTVIWSSFLNSCKIHGDVELGREAADQLIKMEPCNAAPYLSLAQIYAKKGLWNKVAEVRSLMQRRRIRKPAGWSWIEVDKKLHVFAVDDVTHQQSIEIYAELEKIYLGIIEVPTCIS